MKFKLMYWLAEVLCRILGCRSIWARRFEWPYHLCDACDRELNKCIENEDKDKAVTTSKNWWLDDEE